MTPTKNGGITGLSGSAAQSIRSKLETLRHTGKPEVTLNMMYYMLGQFCHRRMFVFTWKEYREKWVSLDRAFGTWFAIFDWDTMKLAKKGGKQEAPGVGLLIEPGSYATLRKWLGSSPPPEVVQEFVDHFKCHQQLLPSSPSRAQNSSREQLEELMRCWEEVFFKPK
ncbi:MAG: hypothetical protein Q8L80_06695 [Gallionella sp.]|nr:hypothetical protein [Gallionella sp.]